MPTSRLPLLLVPALLLAALAPARAAQRPGDDPARDRVRAALDAMGGEAALRGVRSVRATALAHRNLLEQSERPEGPWIPGYEETTQLVDLDGRRLRTRTTNKLYGFTSDALVDGDVAAGVFRGRVGPGTRPQVDAAEERLALGPERLLLTALAAADLHAEPDVVLQEVPHHVAAFTWQGLPVRLFLNAHTHLPTAVEFVRAYPHDVFWGAWGDVTTRTYYSYWSLEAGGVLYPKQWDVVRNGLPDRTTLFQAITLNAPAAADSFAIPDDVRAAFAQRAERTADELPLGRPDRPAKELADGVVKVPGSWDVAFVRQPDGVVVIEAPISSGYAATVLAEAERRFPGVPLKAVVTTSDAWPHLAGAREVAARQLPLYALDVNVPILTRLIEAPHTLHPDAQARSPRQPDFRVVSGRTVVGEGANRLELYPVRGESGERMMLVYFPAHRLLYASDLVQQMPDGTFWQPAYLAEVAAAVAREGLAVDHVFAMHADVMPWSAVTEAIAKAAAPPPAP